MTLFYLVLMKPLTKNLAFTICLIMYLPIAVAAQDKNEYDLIETYKKNNIKVYNRSISLIDNKIIRLNESPDEGIAWLTRLSFSEGTIEIDLRGKNVFQKSFLGIAFHGVNDSTYDAVYFRPFNFYAKDSIRRIHAVQYISHPIFTWKKLREEHNGVYEQGIATAPDPNKWFHARIEVKGDTVNVFVNDRKTPSLTVHKLNNRKNGTLGLWVGDGSGGDFINLKISE